MIQTYKDPKEKLRKSIREVTLMDKLEFAKYRKGSWGNWYN